MAMHSTNGLLKYGVIGILIAGLIVLFFSHGQSTDSTSSISNKFSSKSVKNVAANDSAAESLDTLTAELSNTRQQVNQITKDNATLKQQNDVLLKQMQGKQDTVTSGLSADIDQLKSQLQALHQKNGDYKLNTATGTQSITTVPDLTLASVKNNSVLTNLLGKSSDDTNPQATGDLFNAGSKKQKALIPYYTIPANSTSVHDKLMTALVGRIPVKGVVNDPYPFKLVFSDDTLAANGLRIPHLKQLIVGGYAEGDLNLRAVRGWVTTLTFVFEDGTISTTSSNNNDVGNFTKEGALGFLSDPWGNPFLLGKLITNAPEYLAGNVALGAAQGAASAYSQSQVTNQNSVLGSTSSTVTGSAGKYILGQAGVQAASEAQQWWHDRETQSFDAIYVQPGVEVAVNFTKEIPIDYNLQGRKLDYAKNHTTTHPLD